MVISLMESTVLQTFAITINKNNSELMAPAANASHIHDPRVMVKGVLNLRVVISNKLLRKVDALYANITLDPLWTARAAISQYAKIPEK